MGKRVFITGGSGFIGSNLIKRLLGHGYEITALWRPRSGHPLLDELDFTKCQGDIFELKALIKGMKGADYVFHAAAKISFNRFEYDELCRVNIDGTQNVLNAAREAGVKRLVHLSACAVFGYSNNKNDTLDENSQSDIPQESVYAYTKKIAEEKVMEACSKGLDAVIMNPSTVYGQGDVSLNSGFLIKAILKGRLKMALPGGTSVVAVDDVVDGLMLAMNNGKKGERYILANGNMEYSELCNIVADVLNVDRLKHTIPSFFYRPAVVAALLAETALSVFKKAHPLMTAQIIKEIFGFKYYSSKKAREQLGWQPQVSFGEAVKKAVEFYRAEGLI